MSEKGARIHPNDLFTDYFGNKIEIGDDILRSTNSNLEQRLVVRITPSSIQVKRLPYENMFKPLKLNIWQCKRQQGIINLTKLNLNNKT